MSVDINDFFTVAKSLLSAIVKRGNTRDVGLKNASEKIASIEKTLFDWSAMGFAREPEQIGSGYAAAVEVLNGKAYDGNGDLMFMPNITLPSTLNIRNCPKLFAMSPLLDFSKVSSLTVSSCPSIRQLPLNTNFRPTSVNINSCKNLSSIGDIDVSNCSTLYLGGGCKLDFFPSVKEWDVSQLTTLSLVFGGVCPSEIDLSQHDGKWLPTSLTRFVQIAVPSSVEKVSLRNWGTTKITSMRNSGNDTTSAFKNCLAQIIDITGTSFENCADFSYLFNMNMSTVSVIGELDMMKATNVTSMFFQYRQNGDLKIKDIRLKNVGVSLDLGRCNSLSPASISYLIQNAKTTSGITITLCNRSNSSTSAYNRWKTSDYYSGDISATVAKNITIATSN